ncbi:hypothetical protein GQ55_2G221400 [Panicum hallii var. hallii]|uniref:F-box domain-containing protein n=1 Tax=Panicum hallii var. hallii TaxID=1504633 RepID=A0A2T7ER91_9POAL|nr:hypothetical protein GQ55_2G221400 [Panicum hallii var. hallii]
MDAIPLDLLEVILLLVAWPVFLVRAASTCKQWRRIIARPDFLWRFRCLHRPPVAGYYYETTIRFTPSWWPSGGVDARRFALDFLPGDDDLYIPAVWRLRDSRGSLLLLDHYNHRDGSRDMVVCEPVTRRFQKIRPPAQFARFYSTAAFLLDGDNAQQAAGGISLSSFKVLCLIYYGKHIDARVFTWGESYSWRDTSIDSESMNVIGVAMGSIHWYAGRRKVVTLDKRSAEFSSFTLPAGTEDWDSLVNQHRLAVTASRDGGVRIVVGVAGGDMKVFARLPGGGSCEWVLRKWIPLSSFMAIHGLPWREPWYFSHLPISNHRTGAVLIVTTRMSLSHEPTTTPLMFRVDIETMAAERMPDPNLGTAYPCELPWPPVFRTITKMIDDHGDRAT